MIDNRPEHMAQKKNISVLSQMSTLQRAVTPKDLDEHQDDLSSLIESINNLDGGGSMLLDFFIPNSTYWAQETRLSAMRKYSEMYAAIDQFQNRERGVRMGRNVRTEPDVLTRNSMIEIKTVSGEWPCYTKQMKAAYEQLFGDGEEDLGRVPPQSTGVICIYLSFAFMQKIKDLEDPVLLIKNTAQAFFDTHHQPDPYRRMSLIVHYINPDGSDTECFHQ